MELLKHNIDYIIIGILGVMSFFVLWYTIERIIFYSRVDINGYKNIEKLDEALTKNLTTLYTSTQMPHISDFLARSLAS